MWKEKLIRSTFHCSLSVSELWAFSITIFLTVLRWIHKKLCHGNVLIHTCFNQWSFVCKDVFFSYKNTLRSLLIPVTFWLQQPVLIAAANARLAAIFTSLNCVKGGKVFSSLSLALLAKVPLGFAFHIW